MGRLDRTARRLLAAAVIALCAFAGQAASAEDAAPPHKLTVLLGIQPGTPSLAALWIGKALGYFKQENIDAEIVGMPNGNVAQGVQLVASGQADLTTTSIESVVVPASQGKDTGLVFVYSLFPRPNWRLLVNAKGSITNTAQLKGKTIGLFAPGNPSEPLLGVFLKGAGLTLRDVKLQVVGLGLPAAEALKNGSVDAILMVSPVSAVWQAVGFDFRSLTPPPTFTDLMGPAIAIRRSVLNDPAKREPIVRFLRTWAKATLFVTVNPEAAIKLNYGAYPTAKPRNVSDAQAMTMGEAMQTEMLGDFARKVDGKWGAFHQDSFAKYIAFLGLTDKIPDINALWSNALIPEINDFDANAVIAQAKAYK